MPEARTAAPRLLLLGHAAPPPDLLRCTILARPERHSLVRCAQEADLALLWPDAAEVLTEWLDALAELPSRPPWLCLAPGATEAQRRRAFELGALLWLEQLPADLPAQIEWALWQHERLAGLQAQLDERKWTERAKGLLMSAQALDEDGAFRLLRQTAMQAHLRLGEVSRSVVHAAQQAEAVNLAGQQRMLSQRLVKLMAQRAGGIEPTRAKALQDESAERIAANLMRLPQLCDAGEDLAALEAAWDRLRPLLKGKPTADVLLAADEAAQQLLALSEAFAAALEAQGAGRPLRLVNLCGRQRMLSQRLAKEALLADLLPSRDPELLGAGLQAFEQGLTELEAAPLSSSAIREQLEEVRAEWLRLLRSLRDAHGREAASGLARSSEVLLKRLDTLTVLYQQSLQIILG